jgi:hypothetical protein
MKLTVLHQFCRWPDESELAPATQAMSPFPALLRRFAEDEGIPYLDLAPALRAVAAAGRSPFFAADTHLNGLGHRVMADEVAAFVTALPGGLVSQPAVVVEP